MAWGFCTPGAVGPELAFGTDPDGGCGVPYDVGGGAAAACVPPK